MKEKTSEIQEETPGYATITYKWKLYKKHQDWMLRTKKCYEEVVEFYYCLLAEREEWLELSNQKLLRSLEVLTIGIKRNENIEAEIPLPFEKVPLYFRRAGINSAIRLMRSYVAKRNKWKKDGSAGIKPSRARTFEASPVYYKGMYREWTSDTIQLKLFTGEKWVWDTYRFQTGGRDVEKGMTCQSPLLKITEEQAALHVPILKPVQDIRTVKMRMAAAVKFAAVYCPGNDNLAVCAFFDEQGEAYDSYFVKGGNERKAKCRKLEGLIRKCTDEKLGNVDKYKEKIFALNEYYAHLASRRIVDYCVSHKVKMIIVAKYEKSLGGNQKGFLPKSSYEWIGRRITQYIKYKAFSEGIVTGTVVPYYAASRCHICGAHISKYKEGYRPNRNFYGGELYICPNGHQGNTALNAAKNMGKDFWDLYGNH